MRFLLLMSLILTTTPALAGPWARGVSASFQSIQIVSSGDTFGFDYYAEYGLDAHATLSIASFSMFPLATYPASEIGGQYTLTPFGGNFPIAIGAKARLPADVESWDDVIPNLSVSPTLSAGHGFETAIGHSWITADIAVGYSTDITHLYTAANVQLGVEPFANTLIMLNSSYFTQDEYDKTSFSLAAAVKVAENISIYAEHQWVINEPTANQISFGIWIDG